MGMDISNIRQQLVSHADTKDHLTNHIKNNFVAGFDNKNIYDKHTFKGTLISWVNQVCKAFHIKIGGVDSEDRVRVTLANLIDSGILRLDIQTVTDPQKITNINALMFKKEDLLKAMDGLEPWLNSHFKTAEEHEIIKEDFKLNSTPQEKKALAESSLDDVYKKYREMEKNLAEGLSDRSKYPLMLPALSLPSDPYLRMMCKNSLVKAWSRVLADDKYKSYAFANYDITKDSLEAFQIAKKKTPQAEAVLKKHEVHIKRWTVHSHLKMSITGPAFTIGIHK